MQRSPHREPGAAGAEAAGSRRRFLAAGLGATAAAVVAAEPAPGPAEQPAARPAGPWKPPIIGFTKPFRRLSPDATADLVAEVGWDGVELPVRDGNATHIDPRRVEDDLPPMVEALRKRGREVSIVTTSVVGVDPASERVLRTVARLGIGRVRLGFLRYPRDARPDAFLAECRGPLAEVGGLCRELGLRAGYQNHSGVDFVGAPLWDLWEVFRDVEPGHLGVCFDIGHAIVEGGLSWPVQARLLRDRFVAVFCKDFAWERMAQGQRPRWCPLGEGVVDRSFFGWLRSTGFDGPICQHHEYPDLGDGEAMVRHFKRDLETLRGWLAT